MTIAGPPRCQCGAVFMVWFTRENDPETLKMVKTLLLIANPTADSESGSLVTYLSFLVTIRLSRLVSEIFACDRWTDGQHGPLL